LFCDVPQPPSSRVVVGGVVAAATTGALVAMGHRAGSAWLPFAEMGAGVLRGAGGSGSAAMVTAGVALHVVAMFFWALVFVWLADRLNRVLAASIVGAANFIASWLVARMTGQGLASVLSLGDRVTFALILMVALVVGMRYARPYSRNA
jgi:hypothetical protein